MEQIWVRVDDIVEDFEMVVVLKFYYFYGCKCFIFYDEYLFMFNLLYVYLVDMVFKGVKEINECGVVYDGKEYFFDVLIYVIGFEWMVVVLFNMIKG